MYGGGHSYNYSEEFPGYNFPNLLHHEIEAAGVPAGIMAMSDLPPLNIPPSMGEYDSSSSSLMQDVAAMNIYNTGGCSSSSYGTSPTSSHQSRTNFMQRSLSLHKINAAAGQPPPPPHFIWSNVNTLDFLDSDGTTSVRRACSTGDLQGINSMLHNYRRSESPSMSNEESCSSIIEGMSKACRYSPEEKRERIDKYRSKRNQRNFNKTIKYACRKTLADSRPRIRGRFARNDEIEKVASYNPADWNNHDQYHHQEDEDEELEKWTNFLDPPFSANIIP